MLALVAYFLKPVKRLGPCKRTQHFWPETPNNTQQCCNCMGLYPDPNPNPNLRQRGIQSYVNSKSLHVQLKLYTRGILQRLDTDVHRLWQRKRAQRCDSDGPDSNVTALTVTTLGHQWLWHRCDSDVNISVTAMATDTAVTAVTTDSAVSAVAADTAVTAMFTLVWQRWQLTALWQRCAH